MSEAAVAEAATETEAPAAEASAQTLLSEVKADAPEGSDAATPEGVEQNTDAAPESEPLNYTDFTTPENIPVDGELLDQFKPLAAEFGLSQDQAQKLVDLYADRVTKGVQDQDAAITAQAEDWKAQAKADEEIGGVGLASNVEMARTAIQRFGTPGLLEVLDQTGVGNHPEMIRLLFRVGKSISEDSLVPSGKAGEGPRDPAAVLYGSNQN